MTFEDIGGGAIADRDRTFALINRGYTPDVRQAGQWFETTEDIYHYFLSVLPPRHFQGGAFMMSEASTALLSDAFIQKGKRFFCLTVAHHGNAAFGETVQAFRNHIDAMATR